MLRGHRLSECLNEMILKKSEWNKFLPQPSDYFQCLISTDHQQQPIFKNGTLTAYGGYECRCYVMEGKQSVAEIMNYKVSQLNGFHMFLLLLH